MDLFMSSDVEGSGGVPDSEPTPGKENRMVAVTSTMLPLGEPASDFSLSDPAGRLHSLADFADAPALVVVFLCNHCPYVRHISRELARVTRELLRHGVAVVGISANDIVTHPEDAPDRMVVEAERNGYAFPYLYDETQEVAKAYRAACTPDFYVFDGEQQVGLPRAVRRLPTVQQPAGDRSRPGGRGDRRAGWWDGSLGSPAVDRLQYQVEARHHTGVRGRCLTTCLHDQAVLPSPPSFNER
jgi:peroxiredoxin